MKHFARDSEGQLHPKGVSHCLLSYLQWTSELLAHHLPPGPQAQGGTSPPRTGASGLQGVAGSSPYGFPTAQAPGSQRVHWTLALEEGGPHRRPLPGMYFPL